MAETHIEAEKDYIAGMKYKDIAKKYNVSLNTVKSWKQRYEWSRDKKGMHTKNEKVCTQKKKDAPTQVVKIDDGTKETLQNDELTPEYQMFCIYYSRTFNATQSYLNAFHCSYNTANAEGYKLLVKPCVKAEIERLKEIKRQQIIAGAEDIVELQMRIAFSDIGNYVSFGQEKVPVMAMYGPVKVENEVTGEKETLMQEINVVRLNESDRVDTQIVQEVKQGKSGVSVKLADKQKAMDWLSKYFLMHPDDKYKAEFDRKRAEAGDSSGEEILKNMQTITDILKTPVQNRIIEDYEGNEE